ncbi:DNA-binding protein [Staphylococcus felis]|uniref:DUF87 domain-containing protein n=1 Tax=Staphylococcus felis TaxID=46127 RepID=UPI000E25DA25|nr:DUF87 domain-containing protein [Staphylococcus felis]REI09675.1 DNA-binding protein [Staphylococcus felis]
MSNQFYNYLNKELYKFIENSNTQFGDRFYLVFNNDEELGKLKKAISESEEVQNNRFISQEYNYETIYYRIQNKKVIFIFADEGVTHDFLVTVRNRVSLQKDEWANSLAIFLIKEDLDSITGGAFDLSKKGAPFHSNSLRNKLSNILNDKNQSLSKHEKEILDFIVERNFDDELVRYTLMDFEAIYSIIEKGEIQDEDYLNLGIFKDEQIHTYNNNDVNKRLEENKQLFETIQAIHERGNIKEDIQEKFNGKAVKSLVKDNWYETEFEIVKRSKEASDERKKIQIEFLSDEFMNRYQNFEVWDRPSGKTKVKKRERNIIIFKKDDPTFLNKIILPFSKFIDINKNNIVARNKKIIDLTNNAKTDISFSTSQKSNLVLDLKGLNHKNEYYFEFTYRHNNESNLTFKFRILLLNFSPQKIENLKTKYTIKYDNKNKIVRFMITGVESSLVLNELNEKSEVVDEIGDKYSIENISKLDFTPLIKRDEDEIYIKLEMNGVLYCLELKEINNKPIPLSSLNILKLIYNHKISANFDEKLVKVDTDEFYMFNDFKGILKIEEEFINKKYISGVLNDDVFEGKSLELYANIEQAYYDFCDLIISKNTLPSLIYYDKEVIEAAELYCDVVENVLKTIKDNEKVVNPKILNLHELGILYKNDEIFLTSLHPLVVRYEIEKTKAFYNDDVNEKVFKNYNPSNLLPYYVDVNNNFYFSEVSEESFRWLIYKPYEKSNKISSDKMRYIIKTRMYDFKTHFNYLFKVTSNFALKVKFVGISDKKVVLQGIIDFILEELKRKSNIEDTNSINIYFSSEDNIGNIYNIYNINSYSELESIYNIIIPSAIKRNFDEDDILNLFKKKINIYCTKEEMLTHITFYNFNQTPQFSFNNLKEIEASVSSQGLLSNISYTKLGDTYLTGFGIKGISDEYTLIQSAKVWNSFVASNQNNHLNPFKVNEGIINNIISLEHQNLEDIFDNTNWVTFIDPSVDLSYFNDEKYNLYVIHYNDQTSSFNYESITVTSNSSQYTNILKDFLYKVNVDYQPLNLENIIRSFNILNGEWLLNVIGNKSARHQKADNIVKEKLSIISAYKQVLSILDNKEIKWIPISLEEIIRVSRQQGIDSSSDVFSVKELNHQGTISDDLLFIGLERRNSKTNVHLMPVEVKVGLNNSNVVSKAKDQISHLYELLKNEIISASNKKITQSFYRQFFLNLYFGNLKKFLDNGVINDQGYQSIFNNKAMILNEEIHFTNSINEQYGKGIIVLFTKDNAYRKVVSDKKMNIIEVNYNELDAYEDAEKSLEKVRDETLKGKKGIDLKLILSHSLDTITNESVINQEEEKDDSQNYEEDFLNLPHKQYNTNNISNYIQTKEKVNDKMEETRNTYNNEKFSEDLESIRIPLGYIKGSNETLYWEYGHPKLPNRHLLISGKSGQGKTYFMQCLLYEMAKVKIDSLVVDYTDGFLVNQLEEEFVNSLGDNIVTKYVYRDKIPINPFKKQDIDLGGFKMPEGNDDVADRVVQIIDFVFNLGIQQSSLLKESILEGLQVYGDSFTFTKLKNRLLDSEDNTGPKLVGRISKLLDKDPFVYEGNNFSWKEIFNNQGKVNIFQLKGYVIDIQKVITEFILWDLYNYTERQGDKSFPIPVLLDEMQNLNHKDSSPTTRILKEGRKFGWSSWLATQSISSIKSNGDVSSLFNSAQQIHFSPPEDQINYVSKTLSSDNNKRKELEIELSLLGKGECIVNGYAVINGELRKVIETIEINSLENR